MKINERSPEFQADDERRPLVRACMEGLEAFKRDARIAETTGASSASSGRGLWAWPRPGDMQLEESGATHPKRLWDRKIQGARIQNVWRETVTALAAVPFTVAPTLEGWPVAIQGEENDPKSGFRAAVDDQGRGLGSFWGDLFLWKLVEGVAYNLVTKSEKRRNAFFVQVMAGSLLDAIMDEADGERGLAEARIYMPATKSPATGSDPEKWPEKAVEERVLLYQTSARHRKTVDSNWPADGPPRYRYAHEVRTESGKEEWIWDGEWQSLEVRAGPNVLEIPLYPHYGRQVAPYRGWPVFGDTASLQASHWRKMLDYDARVYKDSRSIGVAIGAEPGETSTAGPNKAHRSRGDILYLPAGAQWEYVETTGNALAALRDDMAVIEQQIRQGNLRPILAQPTVTRTATEAITHEKAAASQLEQWIVDDFVPMRDALAMKARLDGLDPEGGDVSLPHDVSINPSAIERLWDGFIKTDGKLVPASLIYRELSRAQEIGENVDLEKLIRQVEGASLRPPGTTPDEEETTTEQET